MMWPSLNILIYILVPYVYFPKNSITYKYTVYLLEFSLHVAFINSFVYIFRIFNT